MTNQSEEIVRPIPNATHESSINIAGIEMKCHQLDDGRRIIDVEGVNNFFEALANGLEITESDALALAEFKQGKTVMERIDNKESQS